MKHNIKLIAIMKRLKMQLPAARWEYLKLGLEIWAKCLAKPEICLICHLVDVLKIFKWHNVWNKNHNCLNTTKKPKWNHSNNFAFDPVKKPCVASWASTNLACRIGGHSWLQTSSRYQSSHSPCLQQVLLRFPLLDAPVVSSLPEGNAMVYTHTHIYIYIHYILYYIILYYIILYYIILYYIILYYIRCMTYYTPKAKRIYNNRHSAQNPTMALVDLQLTPLFAPALNGIHWEVSQKISPAPHL